MAFNATATKVVHTFHVNVTGLEVTVECGSGVDIEELSQLLEGEEVDSYERIQKLLASEGVDAEVDFESGGTQIDWQYVESDTID